MSFHKEKMELRQTWKRLKVGLVRWEHLDQRKKELLVRYYPIGTVGSGVGDDASEASVSTQAEKAGSVDVESRRDQEECEQEREHKSGVVGEGEEGDTG